MKFFFTSINTKEALEAKKKYQNKYGHNDTKEADVIIAIGGDGFLLKTLHDHKNLQKPFYGINYGSVGFLMNNEVDNDLTETIIHAINAPNNCVTEEITIRRTLGDF